MAATGSGTHAMTPTFETVTTGKAPRVEVKLQRTRYPCRGTPSFAPLRLPEKAVVKLCDMDVSLLRRGRARFLAKLKAGTHDFPITDGPAFRIEVAPETVAGGRLEFGPPEEPDRGDGPVLRSLTVEFNPPVVLPNLLTTLTQVQRVFEDRDTASLRETLAPDRSGNAGGSVITSLVLNRLDRFQKAVSEGAVEPGRIFLSCVSARPKWPEGIGCPDLEIAFSGNVLLFDRFSHPFWDVVLPAAILPVPHAALRHLFSGSPLASGRLRSEMLQTPRMIAAMLGFLAEAEGEIEMEGDVPPDTVSLTAVDGTVLSAESRLHGRMRIKGPFALRHEAEELVVSLPLCEIGPCELADVGLKLDTTLRVAWDGVSPDKDLARRLSLAVRLDLGGGSVLPEVELLCTGTHPLAEGGSSFLLTAKGVRMHGGLDLSWDGRSLSLKPDREGFSLHARFEMPEQTMVRRARGRISGSVRDGALTVEARAAAHGAWKVKADVRGALHADLATEISPIPELRIEDSLLTGRVDASFHVDASALVRLPGPEVPETTVSPSGSVSVELKRADLELDERRLEIPSGAILFGKWRKGEISASGPGGFSVDVSWDLHGKPVLLHGPDKVASLLAPELRQGDLTLHLSPGGRFSFSGEREGLYGIRFFNALLDPADETQELLQLLWDENALGHLTAAIGVFNPDLAELVGRFRRWAMKAREHLAREGIDRVGDAIPRSRIARVLSLLLKDDDSLEAALVPLIRDVTEGRSLDVAAAKAIVRDALGETGWDYELDRLLRWLDLVTAPSEPLPRASPVFEPPLVEDPTLKPALKDLPSATEICRAVEAGSCPPELKDLAPELTLAQLDWIIGRARPEWDAKSLQWLEHVREAKRRVARIEEGYGGLAFAAQSASLATFLGEALGFVPGVEGEEWPPPCCLGPRDVAVLLNAGLSEGRQGLQTQINNRMLLELIRSRPGTFLRDVLVEASLQVPRALTGVLFSFLHQDQDELKDTVDLVELLTEKLGFPIPRREDYLAGGRRARESYYAALAAAADRVYEGAGPYLARRAHLREFFHPIPPGPRPLGVSARLERDAKKAIQAADKLGRGCSWRSSDESRRNRAVAAFREAFAVCAALLHELPTAFQLPWFKAFWQRNEEALKVLSVVRNHQEDVDQVRRWLAITSGRPAPQTEPELFEQVIRCLYYYPEDQEALLADPLVLLGIDPEPGQYDFTVISCMGVVSDGEKGQELKDAYRRLWERRGVRVIRAHTGLFKSLEYNAAAIIRAIRQVDTPWGYVGYSQGCANALTAESFLWGGPPDQQRLLDRFVCRNLLFSAANGSVHGTSGSVKFVRAMVEGERFLKHYQSSFSKEAMDLLWRAMKSMFDSAAFLRTLGGTWSLSLERAAALHRDAQFCPWAPTSTTRGIVTPERIPEALEYLYYTHQRLLPGVPCDSQVAVDEAIGHATRVKNNRTEILARCDMGSRVQATHHWSPLTVEIEMVTTDRDRSLAVYDSPKDRHVFPWIEVNARFGRIRRLP